MSTASGWKPEHSSWTRPGSVSSLLRVPPPMVSALQHRDLDTGGSEGESGSEPVGPAADHDGVGHALTLARTTGCGYSPAGVYPGLRQVTVCGIGPLGSHGCSLTASATFQ